MDKFKIFNEDSYNFITNFNELYNISGGVDHIITDPPYNISKDNNFSTMGRAGIDFGEWDRGEFDLFSWIKPYMELVNKNGSIIIFCAYQYLSYLCDELDKIGVDVKDILIWQKTNPMPRNRDRRYVQDMEFAIWGVKKGAKWIFNRPQEVPYLRSLYSYPLCMGKERTVHPTQKNLALMENIIKVHTNENNIILDPFMGSGTTGVAALKLNRKFIGIERNPEYFDIAKNRLMECNYSYQD